MNMNQGTSQPGDSLITSCGDMHKQLIAQFKKIDTHLTFPNQLTFAPQSLFWSSSTRKHRRRPIQQLDHIRGVQKLSTQHSHFQLTM